MAVNDRLVNQTKVFLHWLAVNNASKITEHKNERALTEVLKASGDIPTQEVIALHNAFIGGLNSK